MPALYFGGTNAYATFGQASGLGVQTFTIETWFRRDGAGTTANTGSGGVLAIPLVTKGRGEEDLSDNRDMNYFLGIRGTDGVLVADFEECAPAQTGCPAGGTAGLNHPVAGATAIPANGVWHHAAATYDGTTWRLYLDGIQDGSLTLPASRLPRWDSIQHAALATALNSTGVPEGYFNGVLDEVRIWNVARTQAEIQVTINSRLSTPLTGMIARWGLDEGSGTVIHSSAGTTIDGNIAQSNWSWIAGAPFNLNFNQPPAQPALVSPANGGTGVVTSPALTVGVTDPDSTNLTVTFYGRAKGTAGANFTLAALPDTQYYTSRTTATSLSACPTYASIFNAQTQWIVDHRTTNNIAFVSHLGDMTETGNNDTDDSEWTVGDAAMKKLEAVNPPAGGIPYGFAPGNHDLTGELRSTRSGSGRRALRGAPITVVLMTRTTAILTMCSMPAA